MSSPASSIACSSGVPSGASIARPSTVTFTVFGALAVAVAAALVELAPAAMEVRPQLRLTFVLDAVLELDQAVEHGLRARRASGYVQIDRDDAIDTLQHGVIVVRTARAGTGAERHDPFRFRHLLPHAAQDRSLTLGYRADHEQQVSLARGKARQRRAETIDIVAGAGDREILHPATRSHERIAEKGILARPLHRVLQPRQGKTFGKGRALVVERMARHPATHHEGRVPAFRTSHIRISFRERAFEGKSNGVPFSAPPPERAAARRIAAPLVHRAGRAHRARAWPNAVEVCGKLGSEAAAAFFALGEFEIGLDHHLDELREIDPRLPAENAARLGGIALQQINLGRAQVTRVGLDVFVPVELE